MVLDSISELATGFEGCEKKLEIDFDLVDEGANLRDIPRDALDSILELAKCTIISKQTNRDFDAYVLSESSLFVYPSKIMLKTCGTTLLLKCTSALLAAARAIGAKPDFLQFSRSNFLFPHRQHFPHRAFSEETDYLNAELGVQGEACILGSLNGARWHLYIWDFNQVDASHYKQQTLEIIMFNLDPTVMKTFYKRDDNDRSYDDKLGKVGTPCITGEEATRSSGIDRLLPNSVIDSHQFTPCGYSCNAVVDVDAWPKPSKTLQARKKTTTNSSTTTTTTSSSSSNGAVSMVTEENTTTSKSFDLIGKQGKHQQAYFTIHITPEPECSFVSFETNAVLPSYTALVRSVVNTFKPGSFCVSLFVDGEADVHDSRSGLAWEYPNYVTKGTTHHAFAGGYNATCSQFELSSTQVSVSDAEYGAMVLDHEPIDPLKCIITSPAHSPLAAPLSTSFVLSGLNGVPSSYETVASLSHEQMRSIAFEASKGHFHIEDVSAAVQQQRTAGATAPSIAPAFVMSSAASASSLSAQADVSTTLLAATASILRLQQPDKPFCVVDLGKLVQRYFQWSQTYARIAPTLSVPSGGLSQGVALVLSALGCTFACRSTEALQSLLSFGVPAARLTLDVPFKSHAQLKYAHEQHVEDVTASTIDELNRIHHAYSHAKVTLHLSVDDSDFGANVAEAQALLTHAKSLHMVVVGVKFDLDGSSSVADVQDVSRFREAFAVVKTVMASAERLGFRINTVYMGAGVPACTSSAATELVQLIEQTFRADVSVYADCAFALNASAAAVASSLLAKKVGGSGASRAVAAADEDGESSRETSTAKRVRVSSSSRYYVHDVFAAAFEASADKAVAVFTKPSHPAVTSASALSLATLHSVVRPSHAILASVPELREGDFLLVPSTLEVAHIGVPAGSSGSTDAPRIYYTWS